MVERIRRGSAGAWAFLPGDCGAAILSALVMVFCTGAGFAEEAKVPARWTWETNQVKVATPKGEEVKTITCFTNCIGVKLVLVPAGEFLMGSPGDEVGRDSNESPQHKVRITRPFYMGACELTQEQYKKIMGNLLPRFEGDTNPAERVNWNDATAFCQMLSQREGVTYRLPTEAEWEYACRAGTTTPFYFGTTITPGQANYNSTGVALQASAEDFPVKPVPVGSFLPNAFGLFDMHGNVYEWCQDWYAGDFYAGSAAEDPKGPDSGDARIMRGGAWFNSAAAMRSAARQWDIPSTRYGMIGFRVVVEVPQ